MTLLNFERYTCIGYDDSTKIAQMITYNKTLMKKMDKLCKDFPDEFKEISKQYEDEKLEGKEYEFPKKYLTIRQPRKRKMTEEEKQKVAERLKSSKKFKKEL